MPHLCNRRVENEFWREHSFPDEPSRILGGFIHALADQTKARDVIHGIFFGAERVIYRKRGHELDVRTAELFKRE